MTDPALCLKDATGLAALIREREVSPVEVVGADPPSRNWPTRQSSETREDRG